jgi:DUF4097 and DUF4098 domain-containing protein YvlB
MKSLAGSKMHVTHVATVPRSSVSAALLTLLILGLFVAAALVISPPIALSAERYDVRGSEVSIYNLAGQVSVVPYKGADVVVELTRGGPDAGRLTIESGPKGDRQTLRVIFPGNRIVYRKLGAHSNTNLHVRRDGTFGDSSVELMGLGNRVTIAGGGRGIDAFADLRIMVPTGKNVRVYVGAGGATASDVSADLRIDTANGAVECHGTRGSLDVDTGSGSVEVRAAQGSVNIDTGSGNVVAEDISGGAIKIDTGSGSVAVNGAKTSSLDVDTGSGSVLVGNLDAPGVRIDTGSGRVSLEMVRDPETITIDTGSGSVMVRLPSSYGAQFEFETGSGGIDIDLPHTLSKREHGYLRGRIGDGGGTFKVDTGSGGIQVLSTGRSSS